MSKTLSATLTRAPGTAYLVGAPAEFSETHAPELARSRSARMPRVGGAARQPAACPRITSNLGEAAGVLSWERDFLLALAVNVLEDFAGNAHEESE